MQKHKLVVGLVAAVLVISGLVWVVVDPVHAPAKDPQRPNVARVQQPESPISEPLSETPLTEVETPERLDKPPAPPLLENDPKTGRVWLRLIDDATNRPIVDKTVELVPAWVPPRKGTYRYRTDQPRIPRATDGDGVLSMSALTVGINDEGGTADVVYNDISIEALQLHVPVPKGWYPLFNIVDLAEALGELREHPSRGPLDLHVREACKVTVTVRDRWGVPVSDAMLRADLISPTEEESDWAGHFCEPDYSIWRSDWLEECEQQHERLPRMQVRCEIGGKLHDDIDHNPHYFRDEGFSEGGSLGVKKYTGLPVMGFGVIAFHPLYGVATAKLNLQSGSNALDVRFEQVERCELRVRVHWKGKPEGGSENVNLHLDPSTPHGVTSYVRNTYGRLQMAWMVPLGSDSWEARITGLSPGWWHAGISHALPEPGELFEVAPGGTKIVDLYVGDEAACRWTPIVNWGGKQLESADVMLLGSDYYRLREVVEHDPAAGNTDALELAPGRWTAYLPTLEPFHLELKPGEERTDVFELQSVKVQFTITQELVDVVGGGRESLLLHLQPVGTWDEMSCFDLAMESNELADAEFCEMKPGITRTWNLPGGEYQWHLDGWEEAFAGYLSIPYTGIMRFDLGLDSLPGYSVLEVQLSGFTPDNAPEVTASGAEELAIEPAPRVKDNNMWLDEPTEMHEDLFRAADARVVRIDHVRYAVISAPGPVKVHVEQGDTGRSFLAQAPGQIEVHLDDLESSMQPNLWIVEQLADPEDLYADGNEFAESEEVEYLDQRIEFYGAAGWYIALHLVFGVEDLSLPPGRVTVAVHRTEYAHSSLARNRYARFDIEITGERVVIELANLSYTDAARVDLVFRGRGSPDKNEDAWWFHEYGPRAIRLLALDDYDRVVVLDWLDSYMPEGRLEFGFRDLVLPPGRYRLIPWPDAPDKYCHEFTLTPGAHSQVTVQGG